MTAVSPSRWLNDSGGRLLDRGVVTVDRVIQRSSRVGRNPIYPAVHSLLTLVRYWKYRRHAH